MRRISSSLERNGDKSCTAGTQVKRSGRGRDEDNERKNEGEDLMKAREERVLSDGWMLIRVRWQSQDKDCVGCSQEESISFADFSRVGHATKE